MVRQWCDHLIVIMKILYCLKGIFILRQPLGFESRHLKKQTFKSKLNAYSQTEWANLTNPTMHLFHIPQYTIQNRNVHISVLNGALWDMGQVHCGICKLGQWSFQDHAENFYWEIVPSSKVAIQNSNVFDTSEVLNQIWNVFMRMKCLHETFTICSMHNISYTGCIWYCFENTCPTRWVDGTPTTEVTPVTIW